MNLKQLVTVCFWQPSFFFFLLNFVLVCTTRLGLLSVISYTNEEMWSYMLMMYSLRKIWLVSSKIDDYGQTKYGEKWYLKMKLMVYLLLLFFSKLSFPFYVPYQSM